MYHSYNKNVNQHNYISNVSNSSFDRDFIDVLFRFPSDPQIFILHAIPVEFSHDTVQQTRVVVDRVDLVSVSLQLSSASPYNSYHPLNKL